jgi:hypothetical protein
VHGGPERVGKAGLLAVVDRVLATERRGTADACADDDPVDPVDLVERVLHEVRGLHGGDLVDDAAVVLLGWGA